MRQVGRRKIRAPSQYPRGSVHLGGSMAGERGSRVEADLWEAWEPAQSSRKRRLVGRNALCEAHPTAEDMGAPLRVKVGLQAAAWSV